MIKSILMLLFFVVLPVGSAQAQISDDRYPSYGNRMTGQPWASRAVERRVSARVRREMRKTISQGFRAEIDRAIELGGRPAGCPARAWCGCWLSAHLGLHRRDLWLARNWARVGRPSSPQAGAIVVWRRHVGKITAVNGDMIRVLSGNDGRRVRDRWRSARGVIAYRAL